MLRYLLFFLLILSLFMNYYLYTEGVRIEGEYNRTIASLWKNFTMLREINRNLTERLELLEERVRSLEEKEIILDFPEGEILEDFIISNSRIRPKDELLRFYVYSQFVYNNITYITEREDFWKHPIKTFWDRRGDCDDRAIFLCYLTRKYFDVYLVSCEDHTFCAISYNCEEFNELLNNSLKEQGYYLPEPMNCYRGNFREIYLDGDVLKERTGYFELISPEKGRCEIKEIFRFKNFGIPRNTSINLKDFFYPEISFDIEYLCLGDKCNGKIRIRNDGFYGLEVSATGAGFEKTIVVGGKDVKEINFQVNEKWIEVKTIFGSKRVELE